MEMSTQENTSKLAKIKASLEKSNSRLNEQRSNLLKPVNTLPLVSVCIPTYNGEGYIAEALSSALLQTYSNIELIISDDNSDDKTVEIIQNVIESECIKECRLLPHERYGIAGNWNFCISQSRGKYIKFLLQDDLLEPNCIEEMVNLAEQEEDIGLVFSQRGLLLASEDNLKDLKILQIYQDAQDFHKDWSNLKSVQTGQDLLADIDLLKSIKRIGEPTTVLIRKEIFNHLGFFDPAFSQALDVEMWLRIMTSYKIGFVDKKLSYWRIHNRQQTYKNVNIGESLFLGDLLHLYYKIYENNRYPSQLREQAFEKYKSISQNHPKLSKQHMDNFTQPINQAFLSKEREFWNVESMYEAMFSRVFTSSEIDKMTLQEKIAAWEDSQHTSVKQILEGIPSQSEWKILEIGCGVGRIIKPLREIFAQVDGVDIAENMIQFAKKYLADGKQNGQVYVNNGCDLQALSSENYDFVYSTIVFQHIRSISVVKNYFREIFRVLKPGGYFKIQVHDYQDNPTAGKFDEEADAETQYNFFGNGYTDKQLAGLLTEQGFDVVLIEWQSPWIWATVHRPQQKIISRDDLVKPQPTKAVFKVSAIIYTYNYARFMRGCLQDLVEQTLYRKGELEIIIIDGDSEQNEGEIVQEYQAKKYPNIVYQRISERLTLYAAWNLGIQAARGQYVTNANSDDRHHPEAFEVMAHYLDEHSEIALVYADQLITRVANDTWARTQAAERWNWPPFSYSELERRCVTGSQPMWRKSLHQKYGYFRSEFVCAGDYEFWLRIGKTESLARLPEVLGLYYVNLQGLEHGSGTAKPETYRIWEEYGILQRGITPASSVPVAVSPSELNQVKSKRILLSENSRNQQKKPLVSVIIPTKDRPEMLEVAVKSILNQDYQNTEIIVVNDGGVDVEELLNRLNYRGNISYVKQDYPRERSAARNAGLRIATGKYISYLDDDDLYYPNHIQTLVEFLENSEYKVAYTDATKAEQEKQDGKYVTINRSVPYSYDFDQDLLRASNYIPILCVMHERACLEQTGVFDETLDTHEDWDLWIRMSLKFKISHINKTTCEFTWRTDGSTTTSRRWDDFERTREIVRNRYSGQVQVNSVVQRIAEQPCVSVIIPTKDRPEMLELAVQSVLNQTHENLHIIVVNDGGVDLQTRLDKLNTKRNITYVNHDRALDRSAARNTGIRAARGKYIAYLDDDDNYYPNHIETLVKFLENSEYQIAYTDAVMAQQEKQNGEYVTVHRSVPYSLDFDKDKILVSNCTPNLCLMHEKSCLDEVGLFDETLSTHEDWDLIIRLSRKFDIAHIKETTCEFTQRNDGTNTSSHNRADFTRTREIIFNKYQPYAEAKSAILEAQKEAFIAEAKELAQQLQQIQAQFTQSLDKLQSQVKEKESQLQQTQAEKSQLSAQVETWQRTTQEVQAKLDVTQSEKEWVKSQLNSWKQTAGEMQIELERSRLKLKQA